MNGGGNRPALPSMAVELTALREEIDQLDDRIHDLLMRRAEIVTVIGKAKRGAGSVFVRPAREAAILRRLAARHRGELPFATVAGIWREMIGAMTLLQARFGLAVFAPKDNPSARDLARREFGRLPVLTEYPSAEAVVRAVGDDRRLLGVLPWPEDQDPDPWWVHLLQARESAPRIIARLPTYGSAQEPAALVLASAFEEASGEDRSFFALESRIPLSCADLLDRFQAAGAPGLTRIWTAKGSRSSSFALLEVEALVLAEEPPLLFLSRDREEIVQLRRIGGYPMPLHGSSPRE